MLLHDCFRRQRADVWPTLAQGVSNSNLSGAMKRQDHHLRLMLTDIAAVGLEFCNQEREAGDLSREALDLNAVEIGERNLATRFVVRSLDDLILDRPHSLVGDYEEIP